MPIRISKNRVALENIPLNEAKGSDIASAATTNIWATNGNTRHITGTTTITSFGTAPQAGAWMKVIFDGALTLTHGANLNLPGSANIVTTANDFAYVYADTTTLFRVLYFTADGRLVAGAASQAQMEAASSNTVFVTPSNIKWSPHVAKVWLYFTNAGTPTIAASLNVSSLTDDGVGVTGINYTTAFSSANYGVGRAATSEEGELATPATGSISFRTRNSGGTLVDKDGWFVAFGDQ